jgi:class 3 adenylate cyclase/tetratricopeptide (TPR) repeat protein
VVTFYLTDIESSTAAWNADPTEMSHAVARLDQLVGEAVETNHGTLLKHRGDEDATLSVFARASDAVAAAVALQLSIGEEVWSTNSPISVRAALHTGEVQLRDGDYHGLTLNRASRIRDLAIGGQILCSQTVAGVAGVLPQGWRLHPLGKRRLRGIADPEPILELTDRPPLSLITDEERLLPPSLRLVGRDIELAVALSAWQQVKSGGGRVLLIAGEPGIGKTRLTLEVTHHAGENGAVVLAGRSDEDSLVPYQPFVEALRKYVRTHLPQHVLDVLGNNGPQLSRLIPELSQIAPGLPEPPRADPVAERHLLFEAILDTITRIASFSPVVVVLDDLHWADPATLLLMRHLARRSVDGVLVIGAYRADGSSPLIELLSALTSDGATTIALEGLAIDAVIEFVSELAPQFLQDEDSNLTKLVDATGGNPLFVEHLVRHALDLGDRAPIAIPDTVKATIDQRLSRLAPTVRQTLSTAAVIGTEFGLDVLECASGSPAESLVVELDEALAAGLIEEFRSGGRYRFRHALVREVLYNGQSATHRALDHQRVASALERLHASDPEEIVSELAHHYVAATALVGAQVGAEYCLRAAAHSLQLLAYEEAATWSRRGLELVGLGSDRIELLLTLGAALSAEGDLTAARLTFLEAADLSRHQDSPIQLGRAAIGVVGPMRWQSKDPSRVSLIEDALSRLSPDEAPALRATLMGVLSLDLEDGTDAKVASAEQSLALARFCEDDTALGMALQATFWADWRPSELPEKLAVTAEAVALAKRSGDLGLAMEARAEQWLALMVAGDMEALRRCETEHAEISERLNHSLGRATTEMMRSHRASRSGRFDEAIGLAFKAIELCPDESILAGFGGVMLWTSLQQGGAIDLEETIAQQAAADPGFSFLQVALAMVHAATGRLDEAAREVDHLSKNGFARLSDQRAWMRPAELAVLSEVAYALADRSLSEAVSELLMPYEDCQVTLSIAAYLGPASYFLGSCAFTGGRLDDACRYFHDAIDDCEKLGAGVVGAHARLRLARTLIGRGDLASAAVQLSAASDDAQRLGLPPLLAEATQLRLATDFV